MISHNLVLVTEKNTFSELSITLLKLILRYYFDPFLKLLGGQNPNYLQVIPE